MLKVSLGMPVFNAEKYLESALEAVMEQTYKDFELTISDNHSTDGSQKICERFADKYENVTYRSWSDNVGAVVNFNDLLGRAKGEYFAWVSDHDLRHPTWLEKCVQCLDENPDVVLVQTKMKRLLFGGGEVNEPGDLDTRGVKRLERFVRTNQLGACHIFYGLCRRNFLIECASLKADVCGADRVTLFELSLKGEFATILEVLFYRVENRRGEREDRRIRRVLKFRNPLDTRDGITNIEMYKDYKKCFFELIEKSGLSTDEKIAAKQFTLWRLGNKYGIRNNMR